MLLRVSLLIERRKVTNMAPTAIRARMDLIMRSVGMRPMNIITTITAPSMAAVEKFSGAISPHTTMTMIAMILKARLRLPFIAPLSMTSLPFFITTRSACVFASTTATVIISPALAISDGWNEMGPKLSQRFALLMAPACNDVYSKRIIEAASRNGPMSIYILQGIL